MFVVFLFLGIQKRKCISWEKTRIFFFPEENVLFSGIVCCIGWLRSGGSIKLQVSFAENSLFYRALLLKRPIILSILLTEATPYRLVARARHFSLEGVNFLFYFIFLFWCIFPGKDTCCLEGYKNKSHTCSLSDTVLCRLVMLTRNSHAQCKRVFFNIDWSFTVQN